MQIVIDISEDDLNFMKDMFADGETPDERSLTETTMYAIAKGTPLLKGHGRLGDLDEIWKALKELEEHYQREFLKESNAIHESAMNGRLYGFTKAKFIVQDAPTIIEADKDGE